MKKISLFAIIVLLLSGCSSSKENNSIQQSTYPISNSSGKMLKNYEDVGTLTNDSPLIVEGKVVANEYINYNNVVFTISTIVVSDVLKSESDIKKGDKITMLQTGGIFTQKSDPGKLKEGESLSKKPDENVENVFEGAPVIKPNKKGIFFLKKYEGPLNSQFVATGDFQGRFPVDEQTGEISSQSEQVKDKFKKIDDLKEKIHSEKTKTK